MKRTQFAAILSPLAALCTHVPASVHAQPLPPHAQPQPRPLHDKLLRAIYQGLIEINTTDSVGSCTVAANAMAARLEAGGFSDADMRAILNDPPDAGALARLYAASAYNNAAVPRFSPTATRLSPSPLGVGWGEGNARTASEGNPLNNFFVADQ